MFRLVRRVALAASIPAAVFAATGSTPAAAEPQPTTERHLMEAVVDRINTERVQAGCPELEDDFDLTVAAVRQSHYMARTGNFTHRGWRGSTFESRSRAAGYDDVAAENIAYGYTNARQVVDAWMESPAHRRNILNCAARSAGVGAQRATDGTVYWTQVFGYR